MNKKLPKKINLYFDGGCQPKNPGGVATSGWFLTDENGKIVAEGAKVVADGGVLATNNYAEYCAVGLGLKFLVENEWSGESLTIRGDSKLVINQISSEWKCKAPHLKKLLEKILIHIDALDVEWSSIWIKRDSNNHAHDLAEKEYQKHLNKKEAKK